MSDQTRREFVKSAAGLMGVGVLTSQKSRAAEYGDSLYGEMDQEDVDALLTREPPHMGDDGFIDYDRDGEISEIDAEIRENLPEWFEEAYGELLHSPAEYKQKAQEDWEKPDSDPLRARITYGDLDKENVEYMAEYLVEPWLKLRGETAEAELVEDAVEFFDDKDEIDGLELFDQVDSYADKNIRNAEDLHLHFTDHSGNIEGTNLRLNGRANVGQRFKDPEVGNTAVIYLGSYWMGRPFKKRAEDSEPTPLYTRNPEDWKAHLVTAHEMEHALGSLHSEINFQNHDTVEAGQKVDGAIAGVMGGSYADRTLNMMQSDIEPAEDSTEGIMMEKLEDIEGEEGFLIHSLTPVGNIPDPVNYRPAEE